MGAHLRGCWRFAEIKRKGQRKIFLRAVKGAKIDWILLWNAKLLGRS